MAKITLPYDIFSGNLSKNELGVLNMVDNVQYEKAMTGSEIAREMNITRQAVSQSLKRAISKVYYNLQESNVTESPTETIMFMRDWFGINDEEDIRQFFDLFPKKIRDEVRNDARNFSIRE